MKPFYTACPCHRQIGQTDDAVLRIGDLEVRKKTVFWCACGQPTHWRPLSDRRAFLVGVALNGAEPGELVKVEV